MPALGTRALVFRMATAATPSTFVDYTDEVSNVQITSTESDTDFVTFAQAAAGGAREYSLVITMAQDTSTTGLWYKIWDEAGDTVPYEVWPNGYNAGTASTTYPKFSGSVVITEPDGAVIGGEADASATARFVSEVTWVCTAKPSMAVS